MRLPKATILKYAKACALHASKLDQIALERLIRGLETHHGNSVSSWSILKATASTGLSKARQEVILIFDLLESLGKVGLLEKLQKRHALRLVKNANKSTLAPVRFLPDVSAFNSAASRLLAAGSMVEFLSLVTMLGSGRRMVDLSRIDATRVKQVSDLGYEAFIRFDKTHNTQIKMFIDFSIIDPEWLPVSLPQITSSFKEHLAASKTPFASISAGSLTKKIKFPLHSIRGLFSVNCTRLGWSDERIMAWAGWSHVSSLKRYRRIGPEALRSAANLTSAVALVNDDLKLAAGLKFGLGL